MTQTIADGEVHVWHAHLDALAASLPRFGSVLAPDEQRRADRFLAEPPRVAFCCTRGILRLLLEFYGVAPAEQIQFEYAPHGKPSLAHIHKAHTLQFNVSHTHGLAVIALTRARAIGIDVEGVRAVPDAEAIVGGQFAQEERAAYFATPLPDRPRAFFTLWTRKEAFLKAVGTGLTWPLNSFAVSLTPDARLLRVDTDPAAVAEWSLADWEAAPAHRVALAVRGARVGAMRHYTFSLPGHSA